MNQKGEKLSQKQAAGITFIGNKTTSIPRISTNHQDFMIEHQFKKVLSAKLKSIYLRASEVILVLKSI